MSLSVLQVYILSTAAEDDEAPFVNRSIDSAVKLFPANLPAFNACMRQLHGVMFRTMTD